MFGWFALCVCVSARSVMKTHTHTTIISAKDASLSSVRVILIILNMDFTDLGQ